MVWLLLVAADAPSDDESLCDARPENGQHWGGVTGRKAQPVISPHFLFRDGPMDDGQANIAEMDIYRYGDHIMTGPSVTLIAIASLVDKAS
ncbi:unnamed protein product [Brugia pahangi]|uniref:Secreted protein n=1 Tax=Brugia pahangi TaxID=6280 RepID=A0A158PPT5_BRUPA|nr:unnamed protein product [Brugia pahangi]